ncbi:MAG TPA: hypothetical protein VFE62_01855 [Gemmataceae bacterium]|nr:hypothetical protein [Gemmataceae bacterium]
METIYIGVIAIALVGQTPAPIKTPYPVEMRIKHEAEIRSGPDRTYYATARMSAGDKVTVLYVVPDNSDWFAIAPPKKSFSWIKGKFLRTINEKMAFVNAQEPVDVYPGSLLVEKKPNAVSAALVHGAIVVISERPRKIEGEQWYPIAPLPSEVRYVHKKDVALPKEAALVTPGPDDSPMLLQRIESLEKRIRELEEHIKK